jgi:hypothetical protein
MSRSKLNERKLRTAEQRDERAPPHSITSSARASSVGGTSRPSALAVRRLITCPFRKSYPDVMVVEPGQNRDGDNDTGPLHRLTQGRVLAQRQVRANLIVQLGNITPTGPRNGKFFMPGIHGLAVWCSFMKR